LSNYNAYMGVDNANKTKLQIAYDAFMKEKANMQAMMVKIKLADHLGANEADLTEQINMDAKFQL
jgi:hypothetical protein